MDQNAEQSFLYKNAPSLDNLSRRLPGKQVELGDGEFTEVHDYDEAFVVTVYESEENEWIVLARCEDGVLFGWINHKSNPRSDDHYFFSLKQIETARGRRSSRFAGKQIYLWETRGFD